ncbi:hypothetical protein HYV86_06130 [Candidatus Woesearchaeota archaeon]|nr:hypothetical protein [Candidatus Woesearchaeota archaeon]
MGWLFGKKKVAPRVPFPEGKFDENALRFPTMPSSMERSIEPDEIKDAVGFGKPISMPEEKPVPRFEIPRSVFPPAPTMRETRNINVATQPVSVGPSPLFIKMDVYQEVLEEFEELKQTLQELGHINHALEQSEYNEENNFARLRRVVKVMHDKFQETDKILFPS